MRGLYRRIVASIVCCTILVAARIRADELPPAIRQTLSENASALENVSLSWTQTSRPTLSPQEMETQLGLGEAHRSMFFTQHWQARFRGNLAYTKTRTPDLTAMPVTERSFDGTWVYDGWPEYFGDDNEIAAALRKQHFKNPRRDIHWIYSEYLWDCGYSTPMLSAVRSKLLHLIDKGARVVATSDVTLHVQRLLKIELELPDPEQSDKKPFDKQKARELMEGLGALTAEQIDHQIELMSRASTQPVSRRETWFLDPARRFALVQRESRFPDGALVFRAFNEEFREVKKGMLWLPRRASAEHYLIGLADRPYPNPLMITDRELESIDFSPPDLASFSLKYTMPNCKISEQSEDGIWTHATIPASAEQLERIIDSKDRGAGAISRRVLLLVSASVAALVIMLVWSALASRRRAAR